MTEIRVEQNTERNIEQAKLLISYIRDYKRSITEIEEKYGIEDSFVLSAYKKELDSMVKSLKKTETLFMEKSDAESVRVSVVSGLRELSVLIKENLKKEQTRYENKIKTIKNFYAKIGNQISGIISQLTKKLTAKLSKKETLSSSEKEIIRSLVRLNETSDAIKEFGEKDFESKEQMRTYYIDIVRSIRKEMALITKLLNSN